MHFKNRKIVFKPCITLVLKTNSMHMLTELLHKPQMETMINFYTIE